ncbi:hypothetical protein [Aquisalimonas sp.]|uniref:hypothetical protein n=1 Tax=Aquisalimonas sp. TaxID=1872621 RepID=UPI0025BE4658|nr:hypothetical protein [Aquisalimonas sp.]
MSVVYSVMAKCVHTGVEEDEQDQRDERPAFALGDILQKQRSGEREDETADTRGDRARRFAPSRAQE